MASKLQPLGDRVLVKPMEKEEKTKSGIYLPDTAKEKPQEGQIVAVGPGKYDETGKRITTRLGPWECISCPAGVIHGYQNDSLEPVYFQVMLGRGKPETMGYADEELYKRRSDHLKAGAA